MGKTEGLCVAERESHSEGGTQSFFLSGPLHAPHISPYSPPPQGQVFPDHLSLGVSMVSTRFLTSSSCFHNMKEEAAREGNHGDSFTQHL